MWLGAAVPACCCGWVLLCLHAAVLACCVVIALEDLLQECVCYL